MKIISFALTALPLLVLANPIAEPEPESRHDGLEKRAKTCKLTGCDVRYHTQPNANSPAPSQISGCGKSVSLSCFTTGSNVNGDTFWDKIASGAGKGYYITEYYIDTNCASGLPAC